MVLALGIPLPSDQMPGTARRYRRIAHILSDDANADNAYPRHTAYTVRTQSILCKGLEYANVDVPAFSGGISPLPDGVCGRALTRGDLAFLHRSVSIDN